MRPPACGRGLHRGDTATMAELAEDVGASPSGDCGGLRDREVRDAPAGGGNRRGVRCPLLGLSRAEEGRLLAFRFVFFLLGVPVANNYRLGVRPFDGVVGQTHAVDSREKKTVQAGGNLLHKNIPHVWESKWPKRGGVLLLCMMLHHLRQIRRASCTRTWPAEREKWGRAMPASTGREGPWRPAGRSHGEPLAG